MNDLTSAFVLVSVTATLVCAPLFVDRAKKDFGDSTTAAALFALPIVWAIYFLIRHFSA